MTHRLVVVLLSSTLLTWGCEGKLPTPTTPTSTLSVAPSAPPQLRALRVLGRVVDGAGNPVAGARVTVWDQPTATASSDLMGAFDLMAPIKEGDRGFWITVEKAGYETSELVRSVDTAETTSLRLHQIRSIAAGESIRSVVNPDDSACGYHWGFICRRVRVTALTSGTVTVEVVADGIVAVGMPVGSVGFPQPLERRVSIPVTAGTEVSVDVATNGSVDAPAGFTLNTSLTPAR
jgi:hypothetical protein